MIPARLESMQLCAITDRRLGIPSTEAAIRQRLLAQVRDWSMGGVEFIQLREKDLGLDELTALATDLHAAIDPKCSKLLINLRSAELAFIALAAHADGVHLAGAPVVGAAHAVRQAFHAWGRNALVSLPCHSLDEVALARDERADLILFSPVFEKLSAVPQGLDMLRKACVVAQGVPVFALGGVTAANAAECIAAGAAGVAGIRLLAGGGWRELLASRPQAEPVKHI